MLVWMIIRVTYVYTHTFKSMSKRDELKIKTVVKIKKKNILYALMAGSCRQYFIIYINVTVMTNASDDGFNEFIS